MSDEDVELQSGSAIFVVATDILAFGIRHWRKGAQCQGRPSIEAKATEKHCVWGAQCEGPWCNFYAEL